jgi:hypothetical protein
MAPAAVVIVHTCSSQRGQRSCSCISLVVILLTLLSGSAFCRHYLRLYRSLRIDRQFAERQIACATAQLEPNAIWRSRDLRAGHLAGDIRRKPIWPVCFCSRVGASARVRD